MSQRTGNQAADGRQAEEGRGVDAHDAAAHLVGGEVLEQRIDRRHGDDHAIAGQGEKESGEIEVAREGESDDGQVKDGGGADHKNAAAADMRERGDGQGPEKSSGAGTGHEDAEAGLI